MQKESQTFIKAYLWVLFFGKIQKRIFQRQKNAKSEKALFSMTTQTNKPRVACKLKKKVAVKFVLEKFLGAFDWEIRI